MSADKDDNEMIPGAVQRSPGICLTAEKNPEIPSMKVGRRIIASHGDPYLHMRSVGFQSRLVMEKEGKKERTGCASYIFEEA